MHSFFEDVSREVEKFKSGVYCSASERNEIDTPYHTHNKGQFIYAEKGTLNIFTNNHHYFLPVEHFIWIPKGVEHRIWTNNSQIMMFTVYFDNSDEASDFFKNTGVYMVNNLLHEMIVFARQWDGHINANNLPALKFMEGFKAILPQISSIGKLPLLGFVRPKNERLLTVMDYMQKNLENKLDATILAAKFGFSDRSLSRLFNAEGISFIEYLQSLRIVKSMELLAENNMNINMAAASVGYESVTAFSNIFLRFTGLRPSEYLKYQI